MEYYSDIKRKTFGSVLMRWMNLEPLIQSEVSQKEKDKYHILTRIKGIWKDDMCAGRQRRHTLKEQIFGLSGRSGWDDLRE